MVAPAGLSPTGTDSARAPFSDAGATGIPGTSLSIPLTDQFQLWRGDSATTARYSNPIPGSLPGHIAGFSPVQRRAQARHLLLQPIHLAVAPSYRRGRPFRAGAMAMAGRVHRLEPAMIANAATGKMAITLTQTNAKFPGINFLAYGRPSAEWPVDNIRALGSEYTSRAWDDRLSPGWGDFVYEAYMDMKSAGVF